MIASRRGHMPQDLDGHATGEVCWDPMVDTGAVFSGK